jgi:hypothetical protein
MDRYGGEGISEILVWHVVNRYCRSLGLEHAAPHDPAPDRAKLCHTSGGELEQIQFLLGHVSVQTRSAIWVASKIWPIR